MGEYSQGAASAMLTALKQARNSKATPLSDLNEKTQNGLASILNTAIKNPQLMH